MRGVGLDAVELDRFREVLARTPGLVDRLFTPDEVAYARKRTDPTERFAARFAAKEAVMKALGIGLGECGWHEIEVVRALAMALTAAAGSGASELLQLDDVQEAFVTRSRMLVTGDFVESYQGGVIAVRQDWAEANGEALERFLGVYRQGLAWVLDPANRAIVPFAKEATPLLANDIRPFVREARPLVQDLRPASTQLAAAAPGLTRTFTQLNNFFNLLAWNPNGREGPDNAARQEGYLFWVAWAQHMAIQLFSSSDANGVFRPVTLAAPCATLENTIKDQPELEFLSMLTPILTDSKACGK